MSGGYVRTDGIHTVAGIVDRPSNAEDLYAAIRLMARVKERSAVFDAEAAAAVAAHVADGRDVTALFASFGYSPTP